MTKYIWGTCLLLSIFCVPSYAQIQKLISVDDSISSFYKVLFWGIRDNTDGVFSRAILDKTLDTLNQHNQISFSNAIGATSNPIVLNDLQRKKLIGNFDGALWGEILKQGSIFKLKFSLFDRNGQLYLSSEKIIEPELNVKNLNRATHDLLAELFSSLPYQGWVVGKKDQLITINFGLKHGAKVGADVDVILITQLRRHPIEGFVTQTEKQIIGKLKIQKVEQDISFCSLVSERYPGIVTIGSKIEAPTLVQYPALIKSQDGTLIKPHLDPREDSIVVGQNPNEWVDRQPQFGLIGFGFGLAQNSINQNLVGPRGSVSGQAQLLPSLSLNGELWLTTHAVLDLMFRQSVGRLSFKEDSKSSTLNYSDSLIKLGVLYRFIFGSDPSLSYFFLGGRFFQFKNAVQETASFDLTSFQYSGLATVLGMRYALPVQRIALIAQMEIPIFTNVTESPVTSGNSQSPSRTFFNIGGEYFIAPTKSLQLTWGSELLSTQFSGTGTRPDSATQSTQYQSIMMLGLNYYF